MAQPSRTWFEEEAPLAASGRMATSRIGRRALASWPRSVAIAVLVASGLTYWRSRVPPTYEVTVVLRVSENGTQQSSGSDLSLGALRSHVSDRALSSSRLMDLMAHHPEIFPGLASDPILALSGLREQLETDISDNDFIEERGSGDPPRSARIALAFRASRPEDAWTVTHALADLLIESTRARERSTLEREEGVAAVMLSRAQADLEAVSRIAGNGPDPTFVAVRERVRNAERDHATAQIALRAALEQQALRLEVVDPGRLPERIDRSAALMTAFLLAFLATLSTSWLLAGAFDPRVLDGDDLTSLGVSILGHTSALPRRLATGERRTRGPRAPRV